MQIREQAVRSIQLAFLMCSMTSASGAGPAAHAQEAGDALPLQARINGAIERGIRHLGKEQHRDGSWTGARFGSYRSGPTAFCAYTLVESGVSIDDPAIRLALAFLREHPPEMTYSAGALLMLLAEVHAQRELSPGLMELADSTLAKLVEWESSSVRGSWGYPTGAIDLSNTQFVALGFWAAHKIGLKVPLDVTQRMVTTTIDVHQEEPFRSPVWLESRGKKKRSNPMIAGYLYGTHLDDPVRASMTVAGVCIQKIAEEIFGRKLGRKVTRPSEESIELAMGWLEAFWSLSENHGAKDQASAPLFLLWGIERLGALFDQEEFFGYEWYKPGATVILEAEKDASGSWGHYDQTSYALLFLSRATRSVSSGKKPEAAPDSWTQVDGPVRFRVTGNMDMSAWLLDLEKKDPVAKVQWELDGAPQDEKEGDPKRPWKGERYPTRWRADSQREARVVAVVTYADGSEARSRPLKVRSSWTPEAWAKRADARLDGGLLTVNMIDPSACTTEASSTAAGQDAARAIDGFEGTAWLADGSDPAPRLELQLDRAVAARYLSLSHPESSVARLKDSSKGAEVHVWINGGAKPLIVTMPAQSAEAIVVPLKNAGKGKVRVRSLKIELRPKGGGVGLRGFAEVRLEEG